MALLVSRPVQTADDLDADAFGTRFQVQDSRNEIVAVRDRGNAKIDLGISLFRNDVRSGAAPDNADIDGHAALQVVHGFERLNDIGELADRTAAVLGPRAGVGGHAFDQDLEARDALAPGDDFSAVAGGLGDQHIFRLASLCLDQRARGRAADLLVGDVKLGYAKRRTLRRRTKLRERMVSEIGAALHIVNARTEGAVALDSERQALDESQGMNRIEVAQHQDSRRILAPRRTRQDV